MDFEQQVNEAMNRSRRGPIRYKPFLAAAIAILLLVGTGKQWLSQRSINSALAEETTRLDEEKTAVAEDLHKYELLASTLSNEIEQLRTENKTLLETIHRLEIQISEAQKQADKAKDLAEQLSDVNTELDQAEARIKSLTMENESLRKSR